MAIQFRSGSTAGGATGTNLQVGVPSGVQDGDILLIHLYHEGGNFSMPAGWNWIGTRYAAYSNACYISTGWHRASSEPANYTFNLDSSVYRTAQMLAFSGCLASGDPIDAQVPYTANTNTTMVCETITTTVANTMLVALMANYWGQASFSGVPNGFSPATLHLDTYSYVADKASTGATGQKTWTFTDPQSGSGYWATRHVALKPASTAPPQTISDITSIDSAEAFGSPTLSQTQTLKPSSDVSAGTWTNQAGSGTALYASVDEVAISDSDYIQSPIKPSSAICTLALETGSDPGVHTNHIVRYRYAKNEAGGNAINLTVRLMQGTTEIANWVHNGIGESWSTAEQTLTSGQAASITDYTALRLRFEASEG